MEVTVNHQFDQALEEAWAEGRAEARRDGLIHTAGMVCTAALILHTTPDDVMFQCRFDAEEHKDIMALLHPDEARPRRSREGLHSVSNDYDEALPQQSGSLSAESPSSAS